MSVVRADRTGPTGFDSSEWNSAANRVIPPSTPSSKTTSAWLRPIWGRAMGALSIFTTRTGRFERLMSIGRPVRGDAAVVGAAGTSGRVVTTVGGAILGTGFGFVVVVDGAARVVVVVGFGRVVVVVEVDVVVVGAGLIVSTRRRSVPQALPTTRASTASTSLRRGPWWFCGISRVMSNRDGTGPGSGSGGPPAGFWLGHPG